MIADLTVYFVHTSRKFALTKKSRAIRKTRKLIRNELTFMPETQCPHPSANNFNVYKILIACSTITTQRTIDHITTHLHKNAFAESQTRERESKHICIYSEFWSSVFFRCGNRQSDHLAY